MWQASISFCGMAMANNTDKYCSIICIKLYDSAMNTFFSNKHHNKKIFCISFVSMVIFYNKLAETLHFMRFGSITLTDQGCDSLRCPRGWSSTNVVCWMTNLILGRSREDAGPWCFHVEWSYCRMETWEPRTWQ